MQFQSKDYTGQYLNKYIECLKSTGKKKNNLIVWKLKCHRCGNIFEGAPSIVKKNYSCGCYKREREKRGNNFWARIREEEILNEPYSEEWR